MTRPPARRWRAAVRFAGQASAAAVVVAAGGALVLGVLVPRVAGATPYTVSTSSMRPALPAGTLVVVRPVDPGDVRVGQAITYQLRSGEPEVVTHRVVAVGETVGGARVFTTRGDANGADDPEPVLAAQVRGAVWYAVPYLGYVSALVTGEQRRWAATALAVVLLAYAAWQLGRYARERRRGAVAGRHRAAVGRAP